MGIKRTLKAGLNRVLRPLKQQILSEHEVGILEVFRWIDDHPVDFIEMIISCERAAGRECTFAQIGANDGILDDPYREYILGYNLTGVLVEPQPDVYSRLVSNYQGNSAVRFANVAISSSTGNLKLFRLVDEKGVADLSNLTTFDRRIAERARDRGHPTARIEECDVPCITLKALLDREQIPHLSLLFIDVEGHELEVIKSLDFHKYRPALIYLEHVNLSPEIELACYDLLAKQGYGFVRQKWETAAISRASAHH